MRVAVFVALLLVVFAAFGMAASCPHKNMNQLQTLTSLDRTDAMREPSTFLELANVLPELHAEFDADFKAMSCDTCTNIVGTIAKVSMNETAMATIINIAKIGCATVFKEQKKIETCQKISNIVLTLLPKATAALLKLEWEAEAFCSLIVPVCTINCCVHKSAPEQVHIALGDREDEMTVSWVAQTETSRPFVSFRRAGTTDNFVIANATSTTYTVSQWNGVVHHATLSGLRPDTVYAYTVVSNEIASETFSFRTLPSRAILGTKASPLRLLQIADLDYGVGKAVVDGMVDIVQSHSYHALLLVGDMGYADGYEAHWDLFMRVLAPVAAYIPVMTAPGNHEMLFNFKAYRTRFQMPNYAVSQNHYYGLRLGTVHISMMSSESQINTPEISDAQIAWFREEQATRAANATWRIAAFHRPVYCTTPASKAQCGVFASLIRKRVEADLIKAGIDLHISGHQHGYERSFPVAHEKRVTQSYERPGAPVYIVSGAGGNREGMREVKVDQEWSATGNTQQGFLTIEIADNKMDVKYYDVTTGRVADEFVITK